MTWVWKKVDLPAAEKGKRKHVGGREDQTGKKVIHHPFSLTCGETHSNNNLCLAGGEGGRLRVIQPGRGVELPLIIQKKEKHLQKYRHSPNPNMNSHILFEK